MPPSPHSTWVLANVFHSQGIETERTQVMQLNKEKAEIRRQWGEKKQEILSRRPNKPQAAIPGRLLKDLKAEWEIEVKDVDEEVRDWSRSRGRGIAS